MHTESIESDDWKVPAPHWNAALRYPFYGTLGKIAQPRIMLAVSSCGTPQALGKDEKVLPQYFKEAGYRTSLIGKWHLGFYQRQYTPTMRGYDSFFGYMGPYIDYYDYTLKDFDSNFTRGFDMRRNLTVANDFDPIYATTLFTNKAVDLISNHDKSTPLYLQLNHLAPHAGNEDFPMQAPADEIAKFSYIPDVQRRTLAG